MTHIAINRFWQTNVQTRGHLVVYDTKAKEDPLYSCWTLELPWRDNDRRVSCIPKGEYNVRHRSARESQKYNYPHFEVTEVKARDYILIHAGNIYKHTLGCILVGTAFSDINSDGQPDVIGSRQALKELRSVTDAWSTLEIDVVDQYAPGKVPGVEPAMLDVVADALEVPTRLTLV